MRTNYTQKKRVLKQNPSGTLSSVDFFSYIFHVPVRLIYPVRERVLLTMCKSVSVMGVPGLDKWGQACQYLVSSPILENNGLSVILEITDSPLFLRI